MVKLSELVARVGGRLEQGDPSLEICGVGSLAEAQPGEVTFFSNPRYQRLLGLTKATAVLVREDWHGACPCARIRVPDPDRAFADVALLLAAPAAAFLPGVAASAVIDPTAQIGHGVHIGPHCVIAAGAVLGADCVLVAGCYIGAAACLGDGCRLYAHAVVRDHCRLGHRVILQDGAVIGSDGFGFTRDKEGRWQKIEQLGIVEIGDDVEIGANTTIDRARFGKTRIGSGVKIDNLVQIGHNAQIGANTIMAAQAGISGSTRIGCGVMIGGQAGIAGHLDIGDRAVIGAQAGVTKSVAPDLFVSGYPAMEHRQAARLHAHLTGLPEIKRRLAAIETNQQQDGGEK